MIFLFYILTYFSNLVRCISCSVYLCYPSQPSVALVYVVNSLVVEPPLLAVIEPFGSHQLLVSLPPLVIPEL